MELLLGFGVAMSVTMALIPPLMRIAGRAQILDLPEARKVHAAPIPRVGGIAMALGILLALAFWGHFGPSLQAYCAGVLLLLVFGVWDDRAQLGAGMKLLGQAAAALIAMLWGGVSIASITLSDRVPLSPWLAQPLTFLFLIGATNAINLSDGLDGLAGGISLLCLAALALLGLTASDQFVAPVALVTAGAILGFLRFNTHPARVFMGDCGSQILGFSVSLLSVELTQDPRVPLSSALPLLLLGMPIIDTLMVMSERLLAGHSPFKADRRHIHHRLLALGLDHRMAVMLIYLLQSLLFCVAWFMRYEPDLSIVVVFGGFAAGVVGFLHLAAARQWRWSAGGSGAGLQAAAVPEGRAAAHERLLRRSSLVASAAIASYFVIVAVRLPSVPGMRWLAAFASAGLALNLAARWRRPEFGWLDKAALYLAAVLAVYIDDHGGRASYSLHVPKIVLFAALALATALRFRWSRDRQFSINALDLLVIFMAVVVPNLPGSIATPEALGAMVTKLILLLYGLESLSAMRDNYWRLLSLAALGFLLRCALLPA